MANSQMLDPTTLELIMIKNVFTPTTGGTITLSQARRQYALLKPAGTLATLTINLPSSPLDGDVVKVGTSQIITALTMSGNGGTLNSGLTTLAVGGFGEWIYDSSSTTWYRFG